MRTTLSKLQKMAHDGEKLAVLTCYDASFAAMLESAGLDILLVGDSLGMVFQGKETTLPVSTEDMAYHTRCVANGAKQPFIITDMPFASYQQSPAKAFGNAAKLMAAGAQMVKLEGGAAMTRTVKFLVERGIAVCGHLGLTPQSVHQLGGYRVQGKDDAAAAQLLADAKALEQAGAGMLVLEMVPAGLAKAVSEQLRIPTIGIGAGPDCSGQVLVLYDLLGIYPGKLPKFAKNFLAGQGNVQAAAVAYVQAVKNGSFPSQEHCF